MSAVEAVILGALGAFLVVVGVSVLAGLALTIRDRRRRRS